MSHNGDRSPDDKPERPLIFLALCINLAIYEVEPFLTDHPRPRGGFRLRKMETGQVYEVLLEDGPPQCTCPDYLYRRKAAGEKCKHIIALEQIMVLSAKGNQP